MSEEQHEVLKEQIMLYSKSIAIHAGRDVSFTKQDLDRLGFLNKEIDGRLKILEEIIEEVTNWKHKSTGLNTLYKRLIEPFLKETKQ